MRRVTPEELVKIEVSHMRSHSVWGAVGLEDDECETCRLIDEIRLSWVEREDYRLQVQNTPLLTWEDFDD